MMRRVSSAAGMVLMIAAIAQQARAQMQVAPAAHAVLAPAPASPLAAAFEAAGWGDLAPLQALLIRAHGDEALLIRAALGAARFDPAAWRSPALARLAAGADPVRRAAALTVLTQASFAAGDYEAAARWGRALGPALTARGDAIGATEAVRNAEVAALLAGHGAQRVEGQLRPARIAARTDQVGLPRIAMTVNGGTEEAVFDTGANLSVLSAETARRLGVTVLDGATQVGNGVAGTVGVRLGVADRVEIAGTTLRNVPFLIIDDAQLTFPVPGGYAIKAIIGLPLMQALGRVRMEADGHFAVLPNEVEAGVALPANLVASGNDILVQVEIAGRVVPLHLDSGANESQLTSRYAAAYPDTIAGLASGTARRASAGGTEQAAVATWTNAPLAFAGRRMLLPSLPVTLSVPGAASARFYGVLGSNALRAFQSYTLDFRAMRLELGEPVAATPAH